MDLEYVKDVTIKTLPHEFRTVSEATLESFEGANENIQETRDFMAIEVHGSCYYFRDPRPGDMELRTQMRKLPTVVQLPPFQHNCLHDLDAIEYEFVIRQQIDLTPRPLLSFASFLNSVTWYMLIPKSSLSLSTGRQSL